MTCSQVDDVVSQSMATFADIPSPGVPALASAGPFAGAWAGYWGGVIPHVLLPGNGGQCVYAVGAVPHWNIPAGLHHWDTTITGGRLILAGAGTIVEYWPDGLDTLAGRYRADLGGDTWGRFIRVTPALLHSAAPLPHPVWGEAVRIPHDVGTLAGIWHAPLASPAPLAVLSHGSSDGVDPRTPVTMEGEARWLRDQGYAVLVPMRRGRGASDGAYGEANCCDLATRAPLDCSAGLAEAVEDLRATISFGLRQPGVRPGPVLLAGQSRGGFLSIAYAGLHPADVAGVVSFVGGWTADWCNGDFNTHRLAQAGAGAAARQLWLHGDNDGYYSADHVRENHAAFTAAGGRAALHMLTGVPYDGHRLAAYPDRWTRFAGDYLDSLPK